MAKAVLKKPEPKPDGVTLTLSIAEAALLRDILGDFHGSVSLAGDTTDMVYDIYESLVDLDLPPTNFVDLRSDTDWQVDGELKLE